MNESTALSGYPQSMARLTKRNIDALTHNNGTKILWDDDPKGLGLKVNKSGSKVFILKYRNQYDQQRKMKIGAYGVLTLDQARKQAREYLADVAIFILRC